MKSLLSLLKAAPARAPDTPIDPKLFRRVRLQTLLSMSLSYALFYVCRLSFNVVKPALVSQDILSPSELGMIGSALFFTYAVGKLVNGFLADHANVRRFMMLGLALSALVNACMGLTTNAVILTLAWGINGWAQSMGVGPCVVSLARWYGDRERGTYYGFWSIAHNLGEALTYVAVAAVVVTWGWQYGYWLATAMGLLGIVLVFAFMSDSPESEGFAPVNSKPELEIKGTVTSVAAIQWLLLKSPALWLLALASCLMYVGRYAVNSWGVFFLENAKHYDTLTASTLISVASICGIAGTGLSGLISDRFFSGRRHGLAIVFGAMNAAGLALFLYAPAGHYWIDVLSMVIFGSSLGALLCFLGGLMAVDIAGKAAAGAALGMIGIVSYIGAAAGEMLTGIIIQRGTTLSAAGIKLYDFNTLSQLWVGAAIGSVLLTCLLAWVARRPRHQPQLITLHANT